MLKEDFIKMIEKDVPDGAHIMLPNIFGNMRQNCNTIQDNMHMDLNTRKLTVYAPQTEEEEDRFNKVKVVHLKGELETIGVENESCDEQSC